MQIDAGPSPKGRAGEELKRFLSAASIEFDERCGYTVILREDGEIIASGSLDNDIIKCVAVSPLHRGEDLSAVLMTQLLNECAARGVQSPLLFTKPRNQSRFAPFGFKPLAETDDCLLMERGHALDNYLKTIPVFAGTAGCVIAHCNPFTLGHGYLIETASKEVDHLYVFILSEEGAMFSARERFETAKSAVKGLPNVSVHPGGRCMISRATFPTYFLKDKARAEDVRCELDVRLFCERIAPALHITRRFAGTEPYCGVTDIYNETMRRLLPAYGLSLREIPRLEAGGRAVSASEVRKLLTSGELEAALALVPEATKQLLKGE